MLLKHIRGRHGGRLIFRDEGGFMIVQHSMHGASRYLGVCAEIQ